MEEEGNTEKLDSRGYTVAKYPNRIRRKAMFRLRSCVVASVMVVCAWIGGSSKACAQGGNSDAVYVALRNATLGTEAVSLTNVDLKRDAGTFRFKS